MKFTPLGSPLNSVQMHFKADSFGEGRRSYDAVKIIHTFTMGK